MRLSVLLAIWGCVALSNPAGMVLEDNSLIRPYLPYVWFGAYLALPSLLAIWVALVQQRPIVRVLQVLGVAALLGTIASWGPGVTRVEYGTEPDFLLLLLSITAVQGLALILLGRRYAWRLNLRRQDEAGKITHPNLGQALLWTAATAGLAGLSIWVARDWQGVTEKLRTTGWFGGTIAVLVFSGVSLPPLILGARLVFGNGKRKQVNVWFKRTIVLLLIGASLAIFAWSMANPSLCNTWLGNLMDATRASLAPLAFFVGYLAALLGSLEVVRSCGFELARGNGNIPSG